MSLFRLFTVLTSLALIAACGVEVDVGDKDKKDSKSSNQAGQTQAATPFKCSSKICDPATQYCLITQNPNNGAEFTSACVALPTDCKMCECAEKDAPKQFPTSNNCSNTIYCSLSDEKISVTCDVPVGRF